MPEAPPAWPLSPRPQGRGLTVVVMGPPGAGVSTQAAQIGAHYGAPVLSLNDVVQWARSGAGGKALADQVREFLKRPVPPVHVGSDDKSLDELAALARAGKVAVPKPLLPANAGKKDGGAGRSAAPPSAADASGGKGKKAGGAESASAFPRLPQALVVEALRVRLGRADAAFAAVIDGVHCDYLADDMEAVGAVRLALTAVGGPVRLVIFEANEYALSHRYCTAMQVRRRPPAPPPSCARLTAPLPRRRSPWPTSLRWPTRLRHPHRRSRRRGRLWGRPWLASEARASRRAA